MKAQQSKIQVLEDLREEMASVLYFFITADIEIYGKVTPSTIRILKKQGIEVPEILT